MTLPTQTFLFEADHWFNIYADKYANLIPDNLI